MIRVFRADDRPPEVIRMKNKFNHPGGFNGWVPLSNKMARELVKYLQGTVNDFSWPAITTNPKKTDIKLGTRHIVTGKMLRMDVDGLAEAIVRAGKSHDTFHISTGSDNTCGGYKSSFNYNYVIDIPGNLYVVHDGGEATLATGLTLDPLKRYVMCNNDDWEKKDSVIFIKNPKLEYTFLTSIRLEWIKWWKKSGALKWEKMNTTELPFKQAKLW